MKRKMWRNKWFILAVMVFLFFAFTGTKVMAAGTDSQLTLILKAIVDLVAAGLAAVIEVFKAL